MKIRNNTALLAVTAALISGAVLAHTGATGIVKERMDGMVALRDGVRDVTPIMRGQVDYDADAVMDFARIVQDHSGQAMTELFPEGSGGMPSQARDTVWSDGEDFEKLAMELEVLGQALEASAVNGLSADNQAETSMSTDLMGTGMDTGMGSMMGLSETDELDIDALAAMSAGDLFTQIGQTCSACHTKYRAEGN